MSGSYSVNGTAFTLQPSTGKWVSRETVGYDGNSHPIYPATREFQVGWELIGPTDFDQIMGFFNNIGITGTAVVSLPKFPNTTYNFFSYSGCIINEPEVDEYFEGYQKSAKLLISRIRT